MSSLATVRRRLRTLERRVPSLKRSETAFSDAHLIAVVARRRPLQALGVDCVAESITVESRLFRAGLTPEFVLGVSLSEASAAHAWVEVDGEPVNAGSDIRERFAAFSGEMPGDHH